MTMAPQWKASFLLKLCQLILVSALGLGVAERAALAHQTGRQAAQGASPAVTDAAAQAQALTQELVTLGAGLQQSGAAPRAGQPAGLIGVAKQRQQQLTILIDGDPRAALNVVLPDSLRAGMPATVQAYLEEPAELAGELEVLHVDYADESQSHYVYRLTTAQGERFSLHFAADAPALQSGTRVRASGVLFRGVTIRDAGQTGGAVVIESGKTNVEILAFAGSTSTTSILTATASGPLPNTFGPQHTVVLLVNFADLQTQPWTLAQAQSLMFSATSAYFQETSYEQTWLTGDVFGWYTSAASSTDCISDQMATDAKAAATAAGVNLAAYGRIVYAFPQTPCGFAGAGTIGGTPSEAWINGVLDSLYVTSHELGHNFGLYHAHALNCGLTASIGTNCTAIEYGDTYESMGSPDAGHYGAFQKERLGWLADGVSPPITTISASGTYSLSPYEVAGTTPRALKILKSTDPTTGAKTWYYVEYRQATGLDSFLSSDSYSWGRGDVTNGVVVHMASGSDGNSSDLLDLNLNTWYTQNIGRPDWFDPALHVGSSFTDPSIGLTITATYADSTTALVSVSFGTPTCVHANPTVALTPSQSQWVAPGTAVTYTVTVTNNDGSACAASTFNLSAVDPSGWGASLAHPSLSLGAGANGSTTLTTASSTSAANGSYAIGATATSSAATTMAGSASATYNVNAAVAVQPPVAVNDSAVTLKNTPVTIAVLANDSDPQGLPLKVASVTQGAHGTVVINANNTVTYTPAPKFTGSDSFAYSVTNGTNAASATVSVQVSGGGKGGGKPTS